MNLPEALLANVRSGRVVLFLGSGASKGAKNAYGGDLPTGIELSSLLYTRFLGDDFNNQPLAWVADLAISESDLVTVQDFIGQQFRDCRPADFHYLIAAFRWRGIVTTNYDRIVETVYDLADKPIQTLVPFISNQERVDEKLRTERSLALVKLHGCITRTHDSQLPLILTIDQYVTHRKFRSRLFDMFKEWAYEYPVVFVGYSLVDQDVRSILLELTDELSISRPRYYVVSPTMSEQEMRFWDGRRVSLLRGSFSDFLKALEQEIPRDRRILQVVNDTTRHPIESKFVGDNSVNELITNALKYDMDYIHSSMAFQASTPYKFYQGFGLGWYPIEQGLDVRRDLTDLFISDVILLDEADRPTTVELYLIKAEAGAGKSIFLKRLAWESAFEWGTLNLYLKEHGRIDYEVIYEICRMSQQRIFLFVDNAIDNSATLESLIRKAKRDDLQLTIITCERINEWNMGCGSLSDCVTQEHKLPYLSRREVTDLIQCLEEHQCLGHLAGMSLPEQINSFEKRAGRQLLVALHEATLGKPYEEILVDEFNEIRPRDAQNIYLTVCILNRLRIRVRAGVISRIYGIPFSDFSKRFFSPLEHVVNVVEQPWLGDYAYEARHPQIAQIVFDRVLTDPIEKFDYYIRLLKALNISYSTDLRAFRKLVLGNTILELFPNHEEAVQIFNAAFEIASHDAFVYHQRAIYEMKRANGSLEKAHEFLTTAKELEPDNDAVLHSLAELFLIRAERTAEPLQKARYRLNSKKIATTLLDREGSRRVAHHTLIKLHISELRDLLNENDPSERTIDEIVKKIEEHLEICLQEFPGDSYLLSAEADLYDVLDSEDKALDALKKAFDANPRNPFLATRLSKFYEEQHNDELALRVVKSALDANPGDQRLHFRCAMLLQNDPNSSIDERLYHLRRSFTQGDRKYEAQFWYALNCFMSGNPERVIESEVLFKHLRGCPIPYETKVEIRYIIAQQGDEVVYKGKIDRKEESFGFIIRDGVADSIFTHVNHVIGSWDDLQVGDRVRFKLGFSYRGPTACAVQRA